jgi:hypothetical protein
VWFWCSLNFMEQVQPSNPYVLADINRSREVVYAA